MNEVPVPASWDQWGKPRALYPFETARVLALREAGCTDEYPHLRYFERLAGEIIPGADGTSVVEGGYVVIRTVDCKTCGICIDDYKGD